MKSQKKCDRRGPPGGSCDSPDRAIDAPTHRLWGLRVDGAIIDVKRKGSATPTMGFQKVRGAIKH